MMQLVWFWLQSEGTGSLEIFHLWLEMEGNVGTLELLRNTDCLMRKDKIWCMVRGIYNCWRKLRGSPALSWTKNSYILHSRV